MIPSGIRNALKLWHTCGKRFILLVMAVNIGPKRPSLNWASDFTPRKPIIDCSMAISVSVTKMIVGVPSWYTHQWLPLNTELLLGKTLLTRKHSLSEGAFIAASSVNGLHMYQYFFPQSSRMVNASWTIGTSTAIWCILNRFESEYNIVHIHTEKWFYIVITIVEHNTRKYHELFAKYWLQVCSTNDVF